MYYNSLPPFFPSTRERGDGGVGGRGEKGKREGGWKRGEEDREGGR